MTISVLQQVPAENHAGLHSTQAVTLTVAASSFLHVCVSFDNSNGTTDFTLASVPSLTWTSLDTLTDSTDSEITEQYVSSTTASGSITITATFLTAQTGHSAIAAKEIGGSSGYDSTAAAHNKQQQPTPTTVADATSSTATPTLTNQPALFSGFCMASAGAGTPAVGTGFTDDGSAWTGFTGTALMRGESKRVTATTGQAATFTAAANTTHQSFVAAFTETGAGTVDNQLMWVKG